MTSRTHVYTMVTVVLSGCYTLLLVALKHPRYASGHGEDSILALLIFLVALAAVLVPLCWWLAGGIGWLTHRNRRDYVRMLRELGVRLSSARPLDEVLSSVTEDLGQAMSLDGMAILLRRPDGACEVCAASGDCCDPAKARSLVLTAAGVMRNRPTERWIPLTARGEMCGFLYVGQRRAPSALASEEIALIETLAAQAAAAVANAVLVDRLRNKVAEMELLRDRLLHVQEEERKRLAQDIHDDVLGILLQMIGRIESARPGLPRGGDAATQLQRAIELGDYAAHRLRETSAGLYPAELKQHGLVAALARLADETNRDENLEVVFMCQGVPGIRGLRPEIEENLYRVVRQALQNTCRHASATRVVITLCGEREQLFVSVSDDGCGFGPAPSSMALLRQGHLGLISMRERVQGLGGQLSIRSTPGKGTDVQVHLPLSKTGKVMSKNVVRTET